MLIRKVEETAARPVEMKGAERVLLRMMVGRDDGAPNFALRHFTIEPGGHTPRHRHDYEHQNYIISGQGTVREEETLHEVRPGDVLFIPPGTLHQFVNTGDTPLVLLCLVPTHFDGDGCREPVPGS